MATITDNIYTSELKTKTSMRQDPAGKRDGSGHFCIVHASKRVLNFLALSSYMRYCGCPFNSFNIFRR